MDIKNIDFKKIKLLILDIDGVLTDSCIYLSDKGEISRKYSVIDGYGIINAIKKGLKIAIITGGKSDSIIHRAKQLGIEMVYTGREDKLNVYLDEIKPKLGIDDSLVAYMADDVYDISLLKTVGVPITVPNAHNEVKKHVKYITKNFGGNGAVREIIDLIIE